MNEKYHEFKLTDLPITEFCILLKPKIQRKIIEDSTGKFDGHFKLAEHLKEKCESLKNIRFETVKKLYFFLWKKCKKFIPIDVFIELCKILKRDHEKLKHDIISLKHRSGKLPITFNFKYNISLATLGEMVKTEGHIISNFRDIQLCNSNAKLINKFKKCLKIFHIPKNSIYENLRVVIDDPQDVSEIISEEGEKIKFNAFIKGKKNKIGFVDKFNYNTTKKYKILTVV